MYLTPGGDSTQYLASLRLEDLESVSTEALEAHAQRWEKDKVTRAAQNILRKMDRV